MKRKLSLVFIAATLVCLLGVTASAAIGGMEYFKSIFGDSIERVGNNVWSPMISDSGDNYKMTVESTLTEGSRNPGGKMISTATFSRILNLNEVKSVFVAGQEYPLTAE